MFFFFVCLFDFLLICRIPNSYWYMFGSCSIYVSINRIFPVGKISLLNVFNRRAGFGLFLDHLFLTGFWLWHQDRSIPSEKSIPSIRLLSLWRSTKTAAAVVLPRAYSRKHVPWTVRLKINSDFTLRYTTLSLLISCSINSKHVGSLLQYKAPWSNFCCDFVLYINTFNWMFTLSWYPCQKLNKLKLKLIS